MRSLSRSAAVVVALAALVAFGAALAPSVLLHEHSGSQVEKDCLGCRSALASVGVFDRRLPSLAAPRPSGPVAPGAVFALDEHRNDADGARGPPRA